mgnify:CR=1 FL=1
MQRLQRRALLRLKGHFQLDNLLLFNRKFFPQWQRRFVVYEKRLDLPRVGIAALAAEALSALQRTRPRVTWGQAGGLVLALASAAALNWSYFVQHGAAAALPALSLRRPLRSLASLFGNRRWLVGFWTGIGGWILLRGRADARAALLVQACAAGGLAVLCRARGHAVAQGAARGGDVDRRPRAARDLTSPAP